MPSIWWFVGHNEAATRAFPSLPIDVVLNAPAYTGERRAGFPHLPVDVVPDAPQAAVAIHGSLPGLPIAVVLGSPVTGQDMLGQLPTIAIDVLLQTEAHMAMSATIPTLPVDVGFVEDGLDAEVEPAPTWPLPTNEPVYHRVDSGTPPVYRRIDR